MSGQVMKTIPVLRTLKTVKIFVKSGNPKCTRLQIKPVTSVVESSFNDRRYLWANGGAYLKYDITDAPEDVKRDIIAVETEARFFIMSFQTGSWKNIYEQFTGLYDVEAERWVFKIGKTDEVGREVYEQTKKQAVEAGYAISNSKPVQNAIAFWLLKNANSDSEEDKIIKAKMLIRQAINLVGVEKVKSLLEDEIN